MISKVNEYFSLIFSTPKHLNDYAEVASISKDYSTAPLHYIIKDIISLLLTLVGMDYPTAISTIPMGMDDDSCNSVSSREVNLKATTFLSAQGGQNPDTTPVSQQSGPSSFLSAQRGQNPNTGFVSQQP